MSTRLLEPRDIAAAVDVLSSAFAGDPLLVWACGARERAGMRASRRMTSTRLLESLADLRRTAPLPCFLFTHLAKNVELYRGLGFEQIGGCPVPNSPLTFWGMRQGAP